MMKNLDIKNSELHIFFRFLKENGLYKAYFQDVKRNHASWSTLNASFKGNLKECLNNYKNSTTGLIDKTLDWENSKYANWESLNAKYYDYYCKHPKVKKHI